MNFYFAIMLLWQEAINFAWVLFIIFKIYLSESYTKSGRERREDAEERGREGRGEARGEERKNIASTGSFSQWLTWAGTRPKPESKVSSGSPIWAEKPKHLG